MRAQTLQEERRVQQRKERPNPPHNQQKKVPFQITNVSDCVWPDEPRVVVNIEQHTTTESAVATEKEGEITLTAIHSCHRPRTPVGHVLIEHRCGSKHCKRGCNKEMKDQTHHTTNKKRSSFKLQMCQTVCVTDEPRVVINIEQHTTSTEGTVATERERDRVHLLDSIVVTALVFHFDTS